MKNDQHNKHDHHFYEHDDYHFDAHDAIGVACGIALVAMFILLYIGVIP